MGRYGIYIVGKYSIGTNLTLKVGLVPMETTKSLHYDFYALFMRYKIDVVTYSFLSLIRKTFWPPNAKKPFYQKIIYCIFHI